MRLQKNIGTRFSSLFIFSTLLLVFSTQRAFAIADAVANQSPPIFSASYYTPGNNVGWHPFATDANGNHYFVGSFNGGPYDFNASVGIDSKATQGTVDVFVSRINANGSYGWTQTFGGADREDLGFGICLSNDGSTVYATGYSYSASVQIGFTGTAMNGNNPNTNDVGFAWIIALNAVDGTAKTGFGTAGMQKFLSAGKTFSGQALCMSSDGLTLYCAGSMGNSSDGKIGGNANAVVTGAGAVDGFVLALNASTGAAVTTFGKSGSGVQTFGGSGYSYCNAIIANSTAIYVVGQTSGGGFSIGSAATGSVTNRKCFIGALTSTGTALAGFGTQGLQFFGGTSNDDGLAVALNNTDGIVYAGGIFTSSDAKIGGTGPSVAANQNFGGADAFIVALNSTSGGAKSGFGINNSGIQTVDADFTESINEMTYASGVLYAVGAYSADAKIGNAGTAIPIDGVRGRGFVLALGATNGLGVGTFGYTSQGFQRIGSPDSSDTYCQGVTVANGFLYVGGYSGSQHVSVGGGDGAANVQAFGGFIYPLNITTGANTLIHPPTDVALSSQTVANNQPSGTTVGTFTTTDPDVKDTFTYTLVAGTGSTDNASFTISGNTLKTAFLSNANTKNSYSIRIRTTDVDFLFFEKAFTITISPAPTVSVVASVPNADEVASTTGEFTFTISAAQTSSTTVNFTVGGTAVIGTDYTSIGTSVVIPANSTTAKVSVTPIKDSNFKTSTTVIVTLASGTAYAVGAPNTGTVTIADVNPNGGGGGTGTINLTQGAAGVVAPTTVAVGASLTLSVEVQNNGTAAAGAFVVRFSLSQNLSSTVADVLIGDASVSGLAAGAKTNAVFTGVCPTVPASAYFIKWSIDANSAVTESNESDNNFSTVTGDFVVTAPTGGANGVSFTSGPSFSPQNPVAGQSISFMAVASPAGATVTWKWDDGSPNFTGSNVSHTFTTAGKHVVTCSASISGGAPLTQTLNITVTQPLPFSTTAGSIKFNFKTPNKDSMAITGNLTLPDNFKPEGKVVTVTIGDYVQDFTLSAKAKGGDKNNTFSLVGKLKDGVYTSPNVKFTVGAKNQNLLDALAVFGFDNVDTEGAETTTVTVILTIDGDSMLDSSDFSFTAHQGKSGTAKLIKN